MSGCGNTSCDCSGTCECAQGSCTCGSCMHHILYPTLPNHTQAPRIRKYLQLQ
ncbi:hypothetical protein CC86DRAFT_296230 [Ophiobolus disseminans]|uniref:Metallothionein n=1 Tax=Ophiobolus disseminans TaxID=1469910 RepID=A0A6A6ZVN8_9PLEO|nr:hypothetical protein CC86DRAFT_296230 [Ophiobolus disseminans]